MGSLLNYAATAGLALLLTVAVPGTPPPDRPSQSKSPSLATVTGQPERPRATVAVGHVPAPARTISVPAGGNLQKALDGARGGDTIALEPGAEYRGPFRLRRFTGDGWVVIRPAVTDAELPPFGQRVTPARFARMPKLTAASGSVISAEAGAHHIRLVGIEIAPVPGTFLYSLVDLGSTATDLASHPRDIIIDRCYLHGDPALGGRRGVALNSGRAAIVDSYFIHFKEIGADSQAIAGWNGPGPYAITNNYLEAAGENIMFGGADPSIAELVPSDITIEGNVLTKPLRWKADDPQYEGVAWTVKNLFELKNARRVLVDGNLLEYNWPHAQNGFAILFTVRNQDGRAPWSVVEDVTFSGNVIRHVAAGINILGYDDNHPSRQTSRISIRENVFADVGGAWGHGRLFQLLDGTRDVTIDHNTAFQTGSLVFGGDARAHERFVFQNNIVLAGSFGFSGSGTGDGPKAIERYFPNSTIRRNVIIGGDSARFPADNYFPATVAEVGAGPASHGQGFKKLSASFAGKATDGRDPGAPLPYRFPVTAERQTTPPAALATTPIPPASTRRDTPAVLFWLSFAVLGYVFIGYPILARIRATLRPVTHHRAPIEPVVTVVVAAHNEAGRIERRVRNLLSLDYPADRLEILIGSDGSTDDTVARARRIGAANVRVRGFSERRGKPALLNDLIAEASGEIIVFADARQRFDTAALRALVANFADPSVGAVSGELVMTAGQEADSSSEGEAVYWQYEKLIRSTESRGGSTVGATGAIYAIRRALFEPVPADTILDDVLIPIRIARRGYKVVFEPAAKAFDVAPATAHAELVRKIRTIGGTFQLFARERWLLNPRVNPLWFETVSHKALRLAIPVLLATMLLTNLALLEWWPYRAMLAGQVAFYAAAVAGCGQRHARRRRMVLTLPYTMCLVSWATIVGFFRFVTHAQSVTWERVGPPNVTSPS